MNQKPYVWPLNDDDMRELRSALDPSVEPWQTPACSGNCAQGRRLCVTPAACRLPDNEDGEPRKQRVPEGAGILLVGLVSVLAATLYLIFIR
jgi:hypothetical protein